MTIKYSGLLTLLFPLLLHAQEQERTEFNKNELSVDFSGLVREHGYPELIYKRHFGNGAIRLRANVSFSNQLVETTKPGSDTATASILNSIENNMFNLQLFLGYQFNRHVARNLVVLYGADFMFSRGSSTIEVIDRFRDAANRNIRVETKTEESIATGFGISPFVGFRYHLGKSFALGMESYWLAAFTSTDQTIAVSVSVPGSTTQVRDLVNPVSFSFSMKPNTLLILGYYF